MAVVIALLAAGLGFIGTACAASLPRQRSLCPGECLLPGFDAVLAGLAALSWITMVLALGRVLSGGAAVIAAAMFGAVAFWRRRESDSGAHSGLMRSRGVVAACIASMLTALAISSIAPPFDARIAA